MRGLIYKDITIFFKSMDKKLVLTAGGAIILLMISTGVHAGLLASVMLAMLIGMQHILSFASDEKANWKKYQLAMPVNALSVVTSKYISVVCTLAFSLAGSILFNLLSSIIFQKFNAIVWGVSAAISLIIPLLCTGICLPLTYWFGFRSAQTLGLIIVIPVYYFVKYFEDGAGFSAMTNSIYSYILLAGITAILIFGISLVISTIGYDNKTNL